MKKGSVRLHRFPLQCLTGASIYDWKPKLARSVGRLEAGCLSPLVKDLQKAREVAIPDSLEEVGRLAHGSP